MSELKRVYKRADGRWEARYVKGINSDGKKLYGATYGKTPEEACEKRAELIGEEKEEQKIPTRLNLLILGAGTHGRDVKEIAEMFRVFHKISFLDDKVTGEGIIGKCKDAMKFRNEYGCAFVAIGDNKKRKKYAKFLKERNFIIPNIISPMASISPNAELGEGVVAFPQCTVGEAKIGDFVILASNSLVNSTAKVESFSRIDAGGIVLKGKRVPEGTLIKSGEIYGKKSE